MRLLLSPLFYPHKLVKFKTHLGLEFFTKENLYLGVFYLGGSIQLKSSLVQVHCSCGYQIVWGQNATKFRVIFTNDIAFEHSIPSVPLQTCHVSNHIKEMIISFIKNTLWKTQEQLRGITSANQTLIFLLLTRGERYGIIIY